jgi:pyruvate dehydrogenase E2 component (dihydrolipoamide acetyltransferase)
MIEITMPSLSESMIEGRLLKWHIKAGAEVSKGDVIAEVETDKANMEIEATADWRVVELRAQPGDMISVGGVLAVAEPHCESTGAV